MHLCGRLLFLETTYAVRGLERLADIPPVERLHQIIQRNRECTDFNFAHLEISLLCHPVIQISRYQGIGWEAERGEGAV